MISVEMTVRQTAAVNARWDDNCEHRLAGQAEPGKMIVVHAGAPSRYVPAHEWGFTSAQETPFDSHQPFLDFPG